MRLAKGLYLKSQTSGLAFFVIAAGCQVKRSANRLAVSASALGQSSAA
jgi:hypothetical protein